MIYFQAQVKLVGSAQHDIKMDEHLGIVIGSLLDFGSDSVPAFSFVFSLPGWPSFPIWKRVRPRDLLVCGDLDSKGGEQARSGSS